MTVEEKYEFLKATIQGKKSGVENFLKGIDPSMEKYSTVKIARGALEDLNDLLKTIENLDK